MLFRSDPRIKSAMTSDTSALTLLNQLHLEIMGTRDPNVLSTSLGQYTAIAAARVARGTVAAPLPLAVTNPPQPMPQAQTTLRQQQMESSKASSISNILKAVSEEAKSSINNLK